jgi:hypothetical protein
MTGNKGAEGATFMKRVRRNLFFFTVSAGLFFSLTGCLNPELVNNATGNSLFPTAPGGEPFVLVRIVNRTDARIDTELVIDKGGAAPQVLTPFIQGKQEFGILFEAPVLRVGIGDLDGNAFLPSSVASFPDGTNVSFPYGHGPLVMGEHYNVGDSIIFVFYQDARAEKTVKVSIGTEDGSTQDGNTFRADTFTTIRQLLELNGLLGPIAEAQTP